MRPWLWLILLPIAIHWPALSGWLSADPIYLQSGLTRSWQTNGVLAGLPGWIDGNSGITLEALGRLVARDWKAGIVPWWNPYSGVGLPLAGEMQPAAFFLPFVLLLGVSGGLLTLKIVLMLVGGLSMRGLLRQLGLRPASCLTGAMLFQLNGTFAWDSDSSSLPVAFLPLFLLGIERAWAAARARGRGGWRLLCVALAYSVVAGFPETAFAGGLLGLAWAILRFCQARRFRAGFSGKVVLGGGLGLMLCAPLLVAFAAFLGRSDMALRAMGHSALGRGDFAIFLFPYLYGPIFFGGLFDMWYRIGGYVGLPVVLLAMAGVFAAIWRREVPQRALRWLLAGWIVLSLAKAGGVPGITGIWNVIPGVAESLFFRYAATSWECAAIVLAALAIDDLLAVDFHARRRVVVCAGLACAVLCAVALAAGRPVWRDLGSVPGGRIWFLLALGWGFGCAGGMAVAAIGRRRRVTAVVAVALIDAAVQFSVPLLAGTRGGAREIDAGAVDFLQRHLGLNRFYTLGPFKPNYGAFYGVAQINHDYAPVPVAWTDYVRAHLDPLAPPVTFDGSAPPPEAGAETRPEALRRRVAEYARVGVKYVLASNWTMPFALGAHSVHRPTAIQPLVLQPGQAEDAEIGPGDYDSGLIGGVALAVGSLGGAAPGNLDVTLCAQDMCAHARDPTFAVVAGNPLLKMTLDKPIRLGGSARWIFRIVNTGGTAPVVLWLWRGAAAPAAKLTGSAGAEPGLLPEMWLLPAETDATARLVFRGRFTDIYELPDPAGYFEAEHCVMQESGREDVRLSCAAPSRLLRRELWFPGWRATVNGKDMPVSRDGIFQTVALQAGGSTVRFDYAPPYVGWAYVAMAVAALGLAGPPFIGNLAVVAAYCGGLRARIGRSR